jgi:hypothetical protein
MYKLCSSRIIWVIINKERRKEVDYGVIIQWIGDVNEESLRGSENLLGGMSLPLESDADMIPSIWGGL